MADKRSLVYEELYPGYYLWWDEYRGWYISGGGKNYRVKVSTNATKTIAKDAAIKGLKAMKIMNPGIEGGKWIPVHAVKFNEDGSVSLLGEHAANPAKLGSGARFKALTSELAAKGARTPKALAAWIGRKKYGSKRFSQLSARGRRKR